MEGFQEQFCTLCHISKNDDDCKEVGEVTKYILKDLLKLHFVDNHKRFICSSCSVKLYAAFDFKATCISYHDNISPYVKLEQTFPFDLRNIYSNLIGTSVSDERICCLRIHPVVGEFVPLQEAEADLLQGFVPGLNFSVFKDAVVCKHCLDKLETHSNFIKNCLDVDAKYGNISSEIVCSKSESNERGENQEMIIEFEGTELKSEEVEIKSESMDEES